MLHNGHDACQLDCRDMHIGNDIANQNQKVQKHGHDLGHP